jgi:hypothetical protein
MSEWKSENMESMNRLCKLQDLSVGEVKHLRFFFLLLLNFACNVIINLN